MNDIFLWITLLSIIGILYPYVLYPFVLQILTVIQRTSLHSLKPKQLNDEEYPSVAVLIAAYNEGDYIVDAIHSIYKEQYPKLSVFVGSDGSTDSTVARVQSLQKEYPTLTLYDLSRRGKNRVNDYLVEHSQSDIIIHLDADCRIMKGSLHAMCSHYSDPEIGAVLGTSIDNPEEDHRIDNHAKEQSRYRNLEVKTRAMESALSSTVTSLGHCYSLRRKYRMPLPNDRVCDDYMPLLTILLQKKRVIAEQYARVIEVRSALPGMEFIQAQRFAACGIASVLEASPLLSPRYGLVSLFLWSRKMLRWLMPVFLLLALLSSIAGMFLGSIICTGFIGAFAIVVMLSIPGFFGVKTIPMRQACIFVRITISLIRAWFHILGSNPSAAWERPTA